LHGSNNKIVVCSCGDLLYDFVSILDYCSNGRMAGEYGVGKYLKLSGYGLLKVFPSICEKGLRKTKMYVFLLLF